MDKAVQVRPRWGRRIGIAFGVLILLLVVVYFVATSAAFLKGVILPKAGKSLNADITVDDASISPFSQVVLKNFRLKPNGKEQLVSANEVRLRYGLMDIIKGHINVDEATIDTATVTLVKEADGSSNLDPLLKGEKKTETKSSGKKPDLNIHNIALKNSTVRITQKQKSGAPNITELSGVNVTLDQLKSGGAGKLTIASDLKMENHPAPSSNDVVAAKISGAYDFAITPDLAPQSVKGSTKIQVTQGQGKFAQAANLAANFDADVTPNNINGVALRFEKSGQRLGEIRAHGPFDLAKTEGSLTVELLSFDRNLLNLAAAGMDFGNSTINSTNRIDIKNKATVFAVDGKLVGRQLGITRDQNPTPPVDLDFDYKVAADLNTKAATLDRILLSAKRNNAEFMTASLDRPMALSWGGTAASVPESALRLVVTNLNLTDWKAMLGTNPPSGVVNATVQAVARDNGQSIALNTQARITDLGLTVGTNAIRNAGVNLSATGTVTKLKQVDLPQVNLVVALNGADAVTTRTAVKYDVDQKAYDAQVTGNVALAPLLNTLQNASAKMSDGVINLDLRAKGGTNETAATGKVALAKLTGSVGSIALSNYNVNLDLNVGMHGDTADLSRIAIALDQGGNAGGNIDLSGRINTKDKSGKVAFNVTNLNQFALAPALQASLGEKKLVSVLMNSSGTATFAPGTNDITANLFVTNLVVKDPAGSLPTNALALSLNVDASTRGQAVDLRALELQLSPTRRAENKLTISAKLDTSTNNPAPGVVSIKSPGLDLTSYYDIFAGNKTNAPAAKNTPAVAASTTTSTNANAEPPAMQLPIKQLTTTIEIAKLFLREVAITNWATTAVISNNNVTLNPLKLSVNGAPINGTVALDLGVPGYKYDIALNVDRVPLQPFVNSFATNQAGKLKGFLVADAKIRGAGTTGASLQKNLDGNANFSITNMDLQIVSPWLRQILVPISIPLQAPELLNTPIDYFDAQMQMGAGKVNIQKAAVQSEAFFANVTGAITLDKVLTNSPLNLPVALSLRRSLAEKAHMLQANTPTSAKYAPLPNFVTVKGTLGNPKSDINKLAVAGELARGIGGVLGDQKFGNQLQGVGNLLTGNSGANTNAPGTNASPASRLVQGLGGLLGNGASPSTNTASTNAPATNAPVQNLLNLFKKPR